MSAKWLACLSLCSGLAMAATEEQKLDALIEQHWQLNLELNPVTASSLGDKRWNDKLEDLSPSALENQHQRLKKQRSQVELIDVSQLSDQGEVNLALLKYQLDNSIDNYRFGAQRIPVNSEWGFYQLSYLPKSIRIQSYQDAKDYLARLQALPEYLDQNVYWMKRGLRDGFSQPQVVLKGKASTFAPFIVEKAQESDFFKPIEEAKAFLSPAEYQDVMARGEAIILQHIVPAYIKTRDFVINEYAKNTRKTLGASQMPGGKAYYENRVKHFTTLDMTGDEIHQLGLEEVARIRNEMQVVIEKTGFKGDFASFVQYLRTDPKFYAKSADELLMRASYLAKKMDAKLPEFFKTLPRKPYGVAPVPESIAPKYTTGRYVGASRDDQPGYYWVNTYALDRRPLYVLEALTLHEAVPGHHLQISLAAEMENVPEFRKHLYISAFGEGWGLYSEWLGQEAGFYQDPYSQFGRLTYEMWRALRLVVDTGIHLKGWSRQQVIDYMAENSALSLHNITTETDRYISWPGQALSYKIGEIKIKSLRKKAEQKLGKKFDIREFHDEVLKRGSIPMALLDKKIEQYIELKSAE